MSSAPPRHRAPSAASAAPPAPSPAPSSADGPVAPAGHARHLTLAQGTALYVAAVLGTGVIALPALAAAAAGPASLLAWLALVALSVPLAGTFAALAARYPDAGGVATYVRHAFGPRASAVVGWCFFFAVPAGAPAAALFAGDYVAAAVGGAHTAWITAYAMLASVAALNAFGVSVSGRVQLRLTVLLVGLLLVAVAASAPHARMANLHPFAPHGWSALGRAAALLVWSFAGWEAITHLAGEFRRPRSDLPRAAGMAVLIVGVLYLGVAAATVCVLGAAAATNPAPLAALLAIGIGGPASWFAAAAALLLTFGTMNAYFAGAAKLGAALGRDGALPAWLARGSQAGDVPRRSLGLLALLALLMMALAGASGIGAPALVLLTTGCFTLVYLLGTAAALRLLRRGSLAWVGACIALAAVAALLAASGRYLLWPLAIGCGALAYQRLRPRPRGAAPAAELRRG
ncbi:APC family permease [Thiomonas sp. FB-6]|uniref:APC family permease n=1 Tax=Thiomonas sp. FB-6 TaxID=1158291 RepID=UPI0003A98A86|nr:amino acid permease [Thiomonas sp. FB-6]